MKPLKFNYNQICTNKSVQAFFVILQSTSNTLTRCFLKTVRLNVQLKQGKSQKKGALHFLFTTQEKLNVQKKMWSRVLKTSLSGLLLSILFFAFFIAAKWETLFSEGGQKPLVLPSVVIGYCCDNETEWVKCPPQEFVIALSEGTFPKHNLIYQQCTRQGWPPFWTVNYTNYSLPSDERALQKRKAQHASPEEQWLMPDIYFCQGFFYHKELVDTRRNANISLHIPLTPELRQWATVHGIRHQKIHHIYHHTKQRPFLTTYNSEPWGDGGSCGERYDMIMDSSIYREWQECPSMHVPPSFWFEYQRVLNNTNHLIHPYYPPPPQMNSRFEEERNRYLDKIVAQKQEFALFMVRDCFIRYYRQDTLVRVVFFLLLSKHYKQVTALGGCKRNVEKHAQLGLDYCPKNAKNGWFLGKKYNCVGFGYTENFFSFLPPLFFNLIDGVVQMLYPYKFYLAMENSRRPGFKKFSLLQISSLIYLKKKKRYSTEKIMNAFYARAIPIYFGDDEVTRYINPKAFIHCKITDDQLKSLLRLNTSVKYDDLERNAMDIVKDELLKCVDLVKRVDTNITLYRQMLSEPVFVNNHWKGTLLDPAVIGKSIRNVLRWHKSHLITESYDDDFLV
ncbi:hypothetical protein RFI_13014 [Reticulomyxa filosa]|uniref:Uncharacterized protein n=1 Tax=Reticulomyxa filosa TaxID=46433 RepID=X6NDR7_RETFI|nr:hypothetical protein RFI_13014 [Reticulomyxa filosa]|eukprot:ETO24146.1 hypothetical protein RFI_13014 [Reticulomyxa filosa]